MTGWSPTFEGFRTVFRRPSLSLAEIIWRFSFGATTCVLFGLATIAYLDTLPVTGGDLLLLKTGHPLLVAQAVAHIFHGSVLRFVVATVIMFSALAIFWILVASLGRAATLGPLLAHIRERAQDRKRALDRQFVQGRLALDQLAEEKMSEPDAAPTPADLLDGHCSGHLRSLAGLHFLRVALGLAACGCGVGAMLLAGSVSTKTDPRPGLAFLVFASLLVLIWALWSSLSWFLAAAPIFVVREGRDAFGALLSTATLFRERPGPVMAVGSWFGLTHLILLIGASTVIGFPMAFVSFTPPVVILAAVLLLTFTYFALVDALYIGRLAGYVAIVEAPPAPPPPPVPPIPPMLPQDSIQMIPQVSAQSLPPGMAMVDQSENILSDASSPVSSPVEVPPQEPTPNPKPPEQSEI
jgi:hypothetical protein